MPPPPGYWWSVTVGSAIAWGIGSAIGNAMWGGFDWGRRDVNINVNRYNVVNDNRRLDAKTAKTRWSHDTRHRGKVPYRGGEATRRQLDRKAQSVKRDNYRGRAEATMRDKGLEVDRAASRDRAPVAAKEAKRDRPQRPTRDVARDRPEPPTREVAGDRAQPGKAQAGGDRAALAQASKQRDQSLQRDRDAARAELNRAGRDHAFKGADSPKARPQIDRGLKSQQAMPQRPMTRPQARPPTQPMAKPQARPMPKPMARPQARPQSKPMARPQGRPQPRGAR